MDNGLKTHVSWTLGTFWGVATAALAVLILEYIKYDASMWSSSPSQFVQWALAYAAWITDPLPVPDKFNRVLQLYCNTSRQNHTASRAVNVFLYTAVTLLTWMLASSWTQWYRTALLFLGMHIVKYYVEWRDVHGISKTELASWLARAIVCMSWFNGTCAVALFWGSHEWVRSDPAKWTIVAHVLCIAHHALTYAVAYIMHYSRPCSAVSCHICNYTDIKHAIPIAVIICHSPGTLFSASMFLAVLVCHCFSHRDTYPFTTTMLGAVVIAIPALPSMRALAAASEHDAIFIATATRVYMIWLHQVIHTLFVDFPSHSSHIPSAIILCRCIFSSLCIVIATTLQSK